MYKIICTFSLSDIKKSGITPKSLSNIHKDYKLQTAEDVQSALKDIFVDVTLQIPRDRESKIASLNFSPISIIIPPKMRLSIQSLGFKKVDIFGAKLGAYSRGDQLTTEDYEMLVVAEN